MPRPVVVTTASLLVGTALFIAMALAVVPMHVTFGAGSLRCGTVLDPDTKGEIGEVCPRARGQHRSASLGAGAVLGLIALIPLVTPAATGRDAGRAVLAAVASLWVVVMLLSLLWIGSGVEYSPPTDVFQL